MGLKISQLPDNAAEDGMMIPASVGGMTYKLLVGIAGGLAKFLHNHEIADVTGLAAYLAEKAPAGYGLGENPVYVADANNAIQNGWYAIDASTLNLPDPTSIFNCSLLRVDVGDRPDVFMLQTACTPYQSWRGCKVQRVRIDGVWQPWEWVNPPMLDGVEYRTTERYMGKPVYCKVVDFGAMPNATTKNVSHGIANINKVCGAVFNYTLLAEDGVFISYKYVSSMLVSNDVIQIVTTTDMSTTTVNVLMKYTKTTD